MFSVGQIFKERGYDLKYNYGGYGYSDNMSYYFSNNGYQIVHRSDLNEEKIRLQMPAVRSGSFQPDFERMRQIVC